MYSKRSVKWDKNKELDERLARLGGGPYRQKTFNFELGKHRTV